MRRRAFVEPTSRLAVWSLRFALVGLAVSAVAVAAARSDWLDGGQAVVAISAGLAIAAIGVVAALAAGATIWVSGYRGARYAVLAALIGCALLAYPAALGLMGLRQQSINDVTTDTTDPPAFDIVAAARPPGANPAAYDRARAPLQRQLYPEIRPLDVDLAPDDVNELLSDLIDTHKWRVLDQVDYRGAARDGRIEMVTRSLILGLRDDIVIRVRTVNGRARIDMRSAARYGGQDFGANARRVIAALDDLRLAARRAQR